MWHRVDYDDDDENCEEEELATSSNNKISIGASIFHFFPLLCNMQAPSPSSFLTSQMNESLSPYYHHPSPTFIQLPSYGHLEHSHCSQLLSPHT
jgi:hypothetical protein